MDPTLLDLIGMFDGQDGQDGQTKTASAAILGEAEAAGRIQARGFADELSKLANAMMGYGGGAAGAGVSGSPAFTAGGPMYGAGQGAKDKAPTKKPAEKTKASGNAEMGCGPGMR